MPSTVNFSTHFDHLDDPRRAQGKLHRLGDILTIALCGVLAGAEEWEDLETYARFKTDWLSERLDLKHGVPGSDTFRRVISRLDPEAFARGFMRWIRGGIAEKIEGEVVAIDGKTVRRSYEAGDPKAALHMLSAWASEQRLVLGMYGYSRCNGHATTCGRQDHRARRRLRAGAQGQPEEASPRGAGIF